MNIKRYIEKLSMIGIVCCVILIWSNAIFGQDWPQWRGPNRDGKLTGFITPKTWPDELTQIWKVTVGIGDATPALVGNKLYVFTRQGMDEVVLCLDANSGKELWRDKYEAVVVEGGPSQEHSGPRSSPTVYDGKVVTLGVGGILSCYDTATGKLLWRKNEIPGWPQFYTSMSPIIFDGLCIALLGGPDEGTIIAYDLATGDQKWKWIGDSPDYGSPALINVSGTKLMITPMKSHMIAIDLTDGKLVWQIPFAPIQRGLNAVTPVINGQTVYYAGTSRGITAVKIQKKGNEFVFNELWHNSDNSVEYNTPMLKNGLLFGLSERGNFFCVNAKTGQTLWSETEGGRGGFGSILDAGSALLILTSKSQLLVVEPSKEGYKELASIKVADTPTYAHPVISGNRLFIKDQDSVILWTIE